MGRALATDIAAEKARHTITVDEMPDSNHGFTITVSPKRAAELIEAVGRLTEERDAARASVDNLIRTCDGYQDRVDHLVFVGEKFRAALRAIVARADTDKPGTSKVQDMLRMAADALGE